jgi:hypothetical protein
VDAGGRQAKATEVGCEIDRRRLVAAVGMVDRGRMAARRISAGLFGAFVGAWLGRAAFKWILDLDGTLLIAPIVGGAAAARSCVSRARSNPNVADRSGTVGSRSGFAGLPTGSRVAGRWICGC